MLVKAGGSASGKYIATFRDAANNTRMHLLADGKVGIGTTAPAVKLEVRGDNAGSTESIVTWGRLDNAVKGILGYHGTNYVTMGALSNHPLAFMQGGNGTNEIAMFIDTDKKVGIGTATPTSTLHVVGTALVTSTANFNGSYTNFGGGSGASGASIESNGRITTDYRIGIGTTTPSVQLQTTGDVIVGGNLTVSGTTFTVDTSNVLVEDPVLLLAKNQTGGAALDAGFIIERGDDTNVGFIWDESNDQFAVINTTEIADDNDITIASYAAFKAGVGTFTGAVTANAGINIDNINIDGTTIALSSGDLILDVAGDILLDADGGDVYFKDAGSTIAKINMDNSDFTIQQNNNDKDIIFKGYDSDGGGLITALTLDMSDAGHANF